MFGTRPEAIKLAPVIHALRDSPIETIVAVTGQHREMLDQVLATFDIHVDVDLDLMRHGQSLHELSARAIGRIGEEIARVDPHLVVVQGDTTTTFAAAYAGYLHQRDVVHIEAGLRSGDRWLPFPEECNRQLTSRISALHLAPTAGARANLLAEGIDPARVVVTGNTVIDALLHTARTASATRPDIVELLADERPRILVTAHRRESWEHGMPRIARALATIATEFPETPIVFPVHRNPVVRTHFDDLAQLPNIHLVEPTDHGEFVLLLRGARMVVTDSGGVQEEAPSLGVPVLVLRESTERPEAIDAGCARLVGTDTGVIVDAMRRLLTDDTAHAAMAHGANPYGDGAAALRTREAMLHLLGRGPRPAEFHPAGDAVASADGSA